METVVLLSGGMDSTTVLAQAIADGATRVWAVTANYNSRHASREQDAARAVVDWYTRMGYDIHHIFVTLPDVFRGAGSSLMGEQDVPRGVYQDPEVEGPSNTEVPFRNANLLSAATAIALTHQAKCLYFGPHASDHRRWAYPDCSPEFVGAMANAIYVGTLHRVRLVTPFIYMTKADVVTRAALLEAPLHLTWSCYEGQLLHCGVCPTCRERIGAFAEAGFADPVAYLIPQNWTNFEVWPTMEGDDADYQS